MSDAVCMNQVSIYFHLFLHVMEQYLMYRFGALLHITAIWDGGVITAGGWWALRLAGAL